MATTEIVNRDGTEIVAKLNKDRERESESKSKIETEPVQIDIAIIIICFQSVSTTAMIACSSYFRIYTSTLDSYRFHRLNFIKSKIVAMDKEDVTTKESKKQIKKENTKTREREKYTRI